MKTILVVLILLASGAAHAQDAEKLYQRGQAAYDQGKYNDAIEAWNHALELAPDTAGLYYNLGQAYRLAGRCTDALNAYRKFIELDVQSAKKPLAEQFITELTSECGAAPVVVEPPKVIPIVEQPKIEEPKIVPKPEKHQAITSSSPGRSKRIAGLVTASSGVVLVLTGSYYGLQARALDSDVTARCAVDCVWADVRADHARGQRYVTYQWIAGGTGIAAIVTGGVLYYLGKRAEASPSMHIVPATGGAVAAWTGTW